MSETTPMTLVHARAMIDRTYSESGRFQWAREVAVNAIEAGATRIDFGLDWNGVEATRTYRRCIADNGSGMSEDELVTFFRTLGGSSKAVGGAHENYGIGAKIALLPWNTAGLVVASWQDGAGNVIWAKADDETGEYGLRQVPVALEDDAEPEIRDVWPVGDDPDLGFDLENLRPDWMGDTGTVVLLLGDILDQHTVRNDPKRDATGTRTLRDYLSRRFWNLPDGVEIRVEEMPNDDPEKWPSSSSDGKPVTSRAVKTSATTVADLAEDSGSFELDQGTRLHWFLRRDPDADAESWAWQRGFIAALYKSELYEHKTKHYDYRAFGVAHENVRRGLWIIVEPRLADDNRRNGAFPEGDRNSLLWNEGGGANAPLPWSEWGQAFADNMPEPVREALDKNRRSGELDNDEYKEKLADLFGERFKMSRFELSSDGAEDVTPTAPRKPHRRAASVSASPPSSDDNDADPEIGAKAGTRAAKDSKRAVALPRWESCGPGDVEEGMIAAFQKVHPKGPTILINVRHSVIHDQISYWTEQYPHDPETVRNVVEEVYGICSVAAVAHSEQLKAIQVDRRTLDEQVRSDQALTLALLGLLPHDQLIAQRLGGKLGRRRVSAPGPSPQLAGDRPSG